MRRCKWEFVFGLLNNNLGASNNVKLKNNRGIIARKALTSRYLYIGVQFSPVQETEAR